MSTDEMKSAIDQLKGLGTLLLIFTGGEPLLRKDIYALIAHAHNAGLITRLSTNGWLLTRENVAKLKRAGLNQCGVGISDADPEVHDRERGLPGIFDKAVQGLRYLHEYKLEGKIISYATNRNTPEGLEQIIALGRRLRAKSVYLNFAYAAGRWDDACDEVLSEEKMEQLRKLHDAVFVHLEFPTPERMCCALKKGYIYVNASGDVTPCPVIPFVMGTIKSEQLTEIWKRHVSTLCLELRGICPVNEKKTREALKAHVESVRTGRSG
jgi:MoaA/NifB/PqqE/SkfB family radical SAM enzyme